MAAKTLAKVQSLPRWAGWSIAALTSVVGAVCLVYFWRVFYYLDARNFNKITLYAAATGLALTAVGTAWLVCCRAKDFAGRAAILLFACGLLYVFANPPMQAPDEYTHYLRTVRISQGQLTFDGETPFEPEVAGLYNSFPGAWVNAHTSMGVLDGEKYYNTAGYALKQYGEDGQVLSVWDSFAAYLNGENTEGKVTEPIVVMILPFLPQAVGMLLARLVGLGSLGWLYAGRVGNLLAYTVLCWLTLKNCRKARPLFFAMMALPLSLYLGASLSYDATLLPCYYLMLSYLTHEKFTQRDAVGYLAAMAWVNLSKPWINLLWVVLPLLFGKQEWKCKLAKWKYALLCPAAAIVTITLTTWYGVTFRSGFTAEALGRMVEGADQVPQLLFVLKHLPRYAAVVMGTLYENDFFLGQLGTFGALDLPVELLNYTGALMLLLGAVLSVPKTHQRMKPLMLVGLGVFSVVYWAGAMTAMYITYTPVGMIRIIGLQARYFLPCFLGLFWLLSQGLSRYLQPKEGDAEGLSLGIFGGYALLGAVLLFQHYFVGPIYTIG